MDTINSYLGRQLLREITPVIMVLSTPLAEQACQKNGLSFVQMLRPFSTFNRLDVPVRTANNQPYRLQMFKLRLFYASEIRQQDRDVQIHVNEDIWQTLEDEMVPPTTVRSNLLETPMKPSSVKKFNASDVCVIGASDDDVCPLWIKSFNEELIHTSGFSEHEAFDHPVACLLVVSSNDEQPINRFVDLFNTDQLPFLLNEGVMDPKILKNYLLLHDNLDDSSERATDILAEMRSTFGLNDCRLLCINSAQVEDLEWKDNPWKTYSADPKIGCYLNVENANEIKDFMQELSSKHIIPQMEQKIRILNQQVSTTRRGFKNQIKNLWWRKKDDMPDTTNGPIYSFNSIESQMRVLADYAFMLRDYELALSNYRLLSTDYKLDKSWKRYAGVQEMLGLSYFMLDQLRKDSEYCMETAFSTYLKMGPLGQKNTTRCGLWWAEMLKAREQYREAANVYFRISAEETSLNAAVMLEQAAYCYLLASPPMLRKYGFHHVLAGNHYYVCDQRQHALRAYRNALCVYKENGWSYINDHVHFNIGRWYAFLGIFDVAMKYMLEVLACGHQPLGTQELFLRDFLQTAQSLGKRFEAHKLQLPVISTSSIKIIYEDHCTYASSSDIHVNEDIWQTLEDEMVPSTTVRSNWLETHMKPFSVKKFNASNVCVIGEAITVDMELKNPLQTSISASEISLICEVSERSEIARIDNGAADGGFPDELLASTSSSGPNDDVSLLVLSEQDLILKGSEAKRVQLHVTPKVECFLKIVGVRWTLSGSVVGFHYFEFHPKKIPMKGKRSTDFSRENLNFIVIKGLPKLEGCIHNLPESVDAGDLRLLKLELRNDSEYTLKNLKMKTSHPRFLIPGSSDDVDVNFPFSLVKQKVFENKDVSPCLLEKSKSLLFSFPHHSFVQGRGNLIWPLWFHAGSDSNISLYLSIYYEMDNCSGDMAYRMLRMHYDVKVLPSLDVSFQIIPCPLILQDFIVHMDAFNRSNTHAFSIHQLLSVGHQWEITSLGSDVSLCPQTLRAGQAVSCIFKLKKRTDEENNATVSSIPLSCLNSEKVLIDVCESPLSNFYHHERLHRGIADQECAASTDFILICKSQMDALDFDPGVGPHLLFFHSCHCKITSKSPLWWLMDGPRKIIHDFSSFFCETNLRLIICNSSNTAASIKIATSDSLYEKNLASNSVQLSDSIGTHNGWYDVSLTSDVKTNSGLQGSQQRRGFFESMPPFLWCATSPAHLRLEPASTAEVSLRVCLFSPGTYNLSNYEINWIQHRPNEEATNDNSMVLSSGVSEGHPYYLTVIQSPC